MKKIHGVLFVLKNITSKTTGIEKKIVTHQKCEIRHFHIVHVIVQ